MLLVIICLVMNVIIKKLRCVPRDSEEKVTDVSSEHVYCMHDACKRWISQIMPLTISCHYILLHTELLLLCTFVHSFYL